MKTILIAVGALVVGIAIGIVFCEATIRHLRKRVAELRAELRDSGKEKKGSLIRSITRFLFVVPPVCAIIWVFWTYTLATYSTVVLEQPFPVESLSIQAIITLLGVSGLKVLENIFEHNEGVVFGQSRAEEVPPVGDDPPDSGGEGEGVG